MSEAAAPEKKKGNKLPMIAAIVLVLAGGGYFGMQSKGGSKEKKEPEIEMGSGDGSIIELEEKLYNLADRATYLRVTMSFQLKKGFDASHLSKDVSAAVEDAVVAVFMSKQPADFFGIENQQKLRREVAEAVNAQLAHHDHSAEHDEDHKDDKKHSKSKKKGSDHDNEHSEEPVEFEHPEWDSDTGPVLKVYLRSLAIQ